MWRSLVAHLFWEQRVAGSNPVIPTDQSRSDHMIRAALSFLTSFARWSRDDAIPASEVFLHSEVDQSHQAQRNRE